MNIIDTNDQDAQPTQTPPERTLLAQAWVAVVLIPVFFLVAFAVTYGLYVLRRTATSLCGWTWLPGSQESWSFSSRAWPLSSPAGGPPGPATGGG